MSRRRVCAHGNSFVSLLASLPLLLLPLFFLLLFHSSFTLITFLSSLHDHPPSIYTSTHPPPPTHSTFHTLVPDLLFRHSPPIRYQNTTNTTKHSSIFRYADVITINRIHTANKCQEH
ncbi:hypothetical protein F5H01DRAFT_214530 [Linnemannia elongata]|nr:hypothetical protein F5H01DRAFT_214530 [Linnemannia elongata]